jgi:hypothetical protein
MHDAGPITSSGPSSPPSVTIRPITTLILPVKLRARRTERGGNDSRAGGSAMWYIIKNHWSVWIAEWHITEVTLDELFDIIDI